MYDIKKLEDEWKRYRKKKLKPWYIGSVILVVLVLLLIFLQINSKMNVGTLQSYFKTTNDNSSFENNEVTKNSVIYSSMQAERSILLDEALDKLEVKENMIEIADKVVKTDEGILVDIPILDDTNENEIETRKKIDLEIIDSTSVSGYKDVEKRFFESHDIDDALFLAKSYYKNGDYNKAEQWALETNKLDENKEESLLIFVKSKVKLGHKNEALSILNAYLKQTDSQEAKKLLYRIENDKL